MTVNYNEAIPYNSDLTYLGGQPVVTPDILPTWTLRVTDKAGVVGPLPEAIVDQMSFESSAPSAISFKVSKGQIGYDRCDDYSIVELVANGIVVKDGRWLLRGKGWNAGTPEGIKNFTGRHLLWDRLENTVIQPGTKRYLYSAKTVGFILNDIFADAQTRDVWYWDNFTWTFNQGVDSNGKAWPNILGTMEYLPTAKYSDIVANLVDKGLIRVSLQGNEIVVESAGSEGNVTPALLVVGEDLTEAPQQSYAQILTDVVVLGDDGIAVTRSNPIARAAYGREEAGISQGGTKDVGTLSLFGDVALSGGSQPRVQRAYGLVITQEREFLPLRDYVVDDWVRTQHSDESVLSARVKQIVLKQDNGSWSGSLYLNDKFIENELRLTKRVDGILGGATIVGNSQTAPNPEDLRDTSIPNAPTGLVIATTAYQDNQGITRVVATFDWAPVTQNTDGSAANDLQDYILVWRYTDLSEDSSTRLFPTESTVTQSGLEPGRGIVARVYARDSNGNISGASESATVETATDDIPPPQPSAPQGSSSLKVFQIEWDGKDVAGELMPPDFSHLNIYSSEVVDFDPETDGQLVGSLRSAGFAYISGGNYEVWDQISFKFVAVDNSGNRSDPSTFDLVELHGIEGPDIVAGSITTNEIAAGSITTALLAAGAITADKISLGQTMNLVVDPSFNNLEMRTRRLSAEFADRPEKWFFNNWSGISRNGYYLQALSSVAGEAGGRMYITDWIACQTGETYYASTMMRNGEFAPNAGATIFLGYEATLQDGTIVYSGTNFTPTGSWVRNGYSLPISDQKWVKIRFFVRGDNLTGGDIAMDDWEVRSGVGTTATSGSRVLATPEGFFGWNASDIKTFEISAVTGNAFFLGQIVSGAAGKRLEINPGATYLPEIRFYADTTAAYAYINAVGTATTPFIGVNAPDNDPSGSFKMVLTDTNMYIGQFTTAISNTGTGIIGDQGDGYLYLIGKMSSAPWNVRGMLTGGRFTTVQGAGSGGGTTTLTINKPTLNGLSIPIAQAMRATDIFFRTHLRGNSSTIWTFRWENYPSDGVTTWTDWILFRGDDI